MAFSSAVFLLVTVGSRPLGLVKADERLGTQILKILSTAIIYHEISAACYDPENGTCKTVHK